MKVATDHRSYKGESFLLQIWMLQPIEKKDILGIPCLFLPMSFLGIGVSEPRTVLSTNERKKRYFSFLGNMHVEFINMIQSLEKMNF